MAVEIEINRIRGSPARSTTYCVNIKFFGQLKTYHWKCQMKRSHITV